MKISCIPEEVKWSVVKASMLRAPRMQICYILKEVMWSMQMSCEDRECKYVTSRKQLRCQRKYVVNAIMLRGSIMQTCYIPKEVNWSTQVCCEDRECKYFRYPKKRSGQRKYVTRTENANILHPKGSEVVNASMLRRPRMQMY